MPKTTNGCEPSQLFGLWSVEPAAFEMLRAHAMAVIESDARYELVARESKAMAEEQRDNPYQVDANGIAHFDVSGPLMRRPTSVQAITGGTSTLLLSQALRKAKADPDVKGALMHVDSPGGHSAVQADLRAELRAFREAKPLAGHVPGAGCSAAYGLLAECDYISADPAGVVGSIGTMMELSDTSKVLERAGVRRYYLTGDADRKAAANPGVAITEQTKEELNKFVSAAGASFREQVRERRPQISEEGMKDVLRGGVYAGADAKTIGLVDDVCDTSTAIERFKQSLSTGSSTRALPVASPTGAVPITQRSVAMLTAEQLTQAKSLPDCADISAENADGKLLAAALSQHAIASRVPALETEIGSLKAQVPQQTPPAVLKAMAGASRIHLKDAVAKQAITPAVAESLASALIGVGDNLVAQGLVPTATGECLASSVFSALAGNGPAPRLGEQVAGQPAPQAVAGAPEIKPITEERRKELLAMSGAHSAE